MNSNSILEQLPVLEVVLILGTAVLGFLSSICGFRWAVARFKPESSKNVIWIFHPHISVFGGGERVVWSMIAGLLENDPKRTVYLLSCSSPQQNLEFLLSKADSDFGISLSKPARTRLRLVPLKFSRLLESEGKIVKYPFASVWMTCIVEAVVYLFTVFLCKAPQPGFVVDTHGSPFTFPLASMLQQAEVVPYVHFPTVDPSVMAGPKAGQESKLKAILRVAAYRLLLVAYRFSGKCISKKGYMTNSNWNARRLSLAWPGAACTVVYPSAKDLQVGKSPITALPKSVDSERRMIIASIGQLRPEKDPKRQIRLFESVKKRVPEAELHIIGGGPDDEYSRSIQAYPALVSPDVAKSVKFFRGIARSEMLSILSRAKCGLHTMVNEHFGIAIAEFMQSYVPVVAHNSGGPKEDILRVENPTDPCLGFLCETDEEFVDRVCYCLTQFKTLDSMRVRAYNSLGRLNDDKSFGLKVSEFIRSG